MNESDIKRLIAIITEEVLSAVGGVRIDRGDGPCT
jgi:hypothetical protein